MLSLTPRAGAGGRCRAGARALVVPLALAAWLTAADLSPNPSSARGGAAPPAAVPAKPRSAAAPVDPDAALQRLAAETARIQPSARDAVARLKAVIRGLIEIERAQNREIAALRGGSSPRGRVVVSRRRSRKQRAPSPAAATPGTIPSPPTDGTPALVQSPPAAGALFGKRGLKKVHRPGCVFGERIKAADRVYFANMKEAAAAGYEPCKICRPDR